IPVDNGFPFFIVEVVPGQKLVTNSTAFVVATLIIRISVDLVQEFLNPIKAHNASPERSDRRRRSGNHDNPSSTGPALSHQANRNFAVQDYTTRVWNLL